MHKLILFCLISLTIASNLFSQGNKRITRQEYISKYSSIAIREMKAEGIPASITLAQGAYESDDGNSYLAKNAKNHFGIKCANGWTGDTAIRDDDTKDECFRKYKCVEDSYRDHSEFLKKAKRYAFLFDIEVTNYRDWAYGLKKAGYATNPKYPETLIKIIEDNKLYLYDDAKTVNVNKPKKINDFTGRDVEDFTFSPLGRKIFVRNRVQYIVAKRGDTYKKIGKEFDLFVTQIKKFNDISVDDEVKDGQIIYVQPKRNKADKENEYHTVKAGETMYSISQLYGVKLKKLYKKNNLTAGEKVKAGTKLWLRSRKRN